MIPLLVGGLLSLVISSLSGCARSTPELAASPAPSRALVTAPATSAALAGATSSIATTVSFKFATQTLTVPAGFTVEQVAGPPLVNRPISIAFDEAGRLYVTDSSGLSDRAPIQFAQKPHRVVRLTDADDDGRFEQGTVFAENMMFPQGALFYEGSLFVGAPPHIWKLTDRDGDGISDERLPWYDGKTLTGCANDLHGPYLGLDGWIYWTKGAAAEQNHTLPSGQPYTTRAAHIFRSHSSRPGVEPVMTGGMDNPVGVTFTATGERILSGTFFQIGVPGQRDGLIHAIYGGVYGKDQPSIAGHRRTGDLLPIMTHMGAAAPCGSTTYRSSGFGPEYRENVFVCYFNLRKISRHQLVPEGATFKTIDTDFLTSDSSDFHPTDVLEDADGSLLVVDTGGWYKICCPTSQLAKPDVLGGIYRIRKTGAPKVSDPRGRQLPWAKLTPTDTAKLLSDSRPYVVDRAIHQLGQAGSAAVSALASSALNSPTAAVRRHALWTLARIDAPEARAAVRAALPDSDASVVHTALQVVSLFRDAPAFDALIGVVIGDRPSLTRLAAEALGRIGDARAIGPLLAAAQRLGNGPFTASGTPQNPGEQVLEHALTYALIEISNPTPLLASLQSANAPRAARVALVALDQMPAGGLQPEHVLPWLNSPVGRLKQTAGWIVSHRPEWGEALSSHYRQRLANPPAAESERLELQVQLATLAKAPAVQELVAATVADTQAPLATRQLALRIMAAAALKETPPNWFTELARLIESTEPDLVAQAVSTSRTLPRPKTGPAALTAALSKVGRNAAYPAAVRLEALAIASANLGPIEPALFEFLRAHVDRGQPMGQRHHAAAALAAARLSADQQLALADAMKTTGPLEAPKLLPVFEKSPTETLGLRLVAALEKSPAQAGLRGNVLKPVLAKYPAAVQQRAEPLLAALNGNVAQENARIDELLATVKDGDVRRGQAVFNRANSACTLCHTIGYLGGKLGPDLTSIGKIRNERELLEAIVFPSATFVRGYEPYNATTTTGEVHSGILRQDTAEEVVLATSPDTLQRIARAQLADLQPGAVSSMPPGMDAVLSRQELADLVAFLKSRQ